jgi:hypothetical protein
LTGQSLLLLGSMLYLSGIICLSISLNENSSPGTIVRETLRRWAKFLGLTAVLVLIVQGLSCL